jgi:hypothetical protein
MKIMKKIVRLTESDLNRIIRRVINESDEKTIDDVEITRKIEDSLGDSEGGYPVEKTIDNGKLTKKIKYSLGASEGRYLFQINEKLHNSGYVFIGTNYRKDRKFVYIPMDEINYGLEKSHIFGGFGMAGRWKIDGTKLILRFDN